MPAEWITYKNKQVLLADFSNIIRESQMIAVVDTFPDLIKDVPDGGFLLALTDLTNAYALPGFIEANKRFEKEHIERRNIKIKRAIVGVTGPKAVLLKGYNLFTKQKIHPFNSREEALEYLVS